MAVVLDAVDGGTSSTSTITSAGASPNGNDRLMLVCATGRSAADDVKTGGSGGTSLTKISGDASLFFDTWIGNVWRIFPGPTGSTTGWVDFGSGTSSAFSILYLEGVDQTTPNTTAQTAGPTGSSTPSLALTGLSAGQDVRVALMVGHLPSGLSGFTVNGSTTIDRQDYGPVEGERQSSTLWLSGVADGSGNVTIGGTLTSGFDTGEWYMYGFGINAAASGTSHPSTGALTAQSATVAGTATHLNQHPSTGALSAQSATVAGTAAHTRQHPSTGALTAQSATVAGTATHLNQHPSTGELTAQSATVAGTAARTRQHPSAGELSAQAATVEGTATRFRAHPATGELSAQAATVAGDATVTPAAGPHPSTGDLQAQSATVAGSAEVTHLAPIVVFDGHDGGRNSKSKAPDFKQYKEAKARLRKQIEAAFSGEEPSEVKEVKAEAEKVLTQTVRRQDIAAAMETIKLLESALESAQDEEDLLRILL